MNLDFSVDNAHIHEETRVAKNIQLCHNRLLASPFLLSLATSMKHGVFQLFWRHPHRHSPAKCVWKFLNGFKTDQ